MLNYSEEDIKNAAELRDWVLKQISEKQEEIDRLKRLLLLIDNLLKQGSFKPASKLERSINNSESSTINERPQDSNKATMKVENKQSNSTATTNSNENVSPFTETRDLKRLTDIINTSAWVFTRMLEKEKDNASGSRT